MWCMCTPRRLSEKIELHEKCLEELKPINSRVWSFPWDPTRADECIQIVLASVDHIIASHHQDLLNGSHLCINMNNCTMSMRKCGIVDPRYTLKIQKNQVDSWPHEMKNIRQWLQFHMKT